MKTYNKDEEAAKQVHKISMHEKLRKVPAIGIVFALFSAFFIATGTLVVKLVNDLHPIEIAVIRSIVQAVCYLAFILITRTSFRPASGEKLYLSLRCVFGFMSVACGFISLRMIPLGDSSAIIYSAPVFVAVVARIFLKEKCDFVNVIALFVTAAGVVLITKPSFLFPDEDLIEEQHRLIGSLLALGGAFGAACAFVSIRKLQKTPSSVVIFWHSISLIILGSIVLVSIDELQIPYGFRNLSLLFGMGLCGTFGQLCVTLAFKLEEAGPVSLARTVSIAIAFMYQVFILNEELVWTSIVGACIVFAAVVSIALRKWYKLRPETFMCCYQPQVDEKSTDSDEKEKNVC